MPVELLVRCAHTPSYVGSHVTGWDNMFEGIMRSFTLNHMADKAPGKNGKLNFVPGFETYLRNFRVIKRMMAEMGVEATLLSDPTEVLDTPADGEFRMYAGGTTQAEIKDAPNAISTLLLQPYKLDKTKKLLENTWNHEVPKLNIPMGVDWTDELLMKVSELTGKPIPESLAKERGRLVNMMSDSHAIAIYRVAQEALTNIRKHAQANTVTIRLTDEGDTVKLDIRDDGVGLPEGARGKTGSHGLLGMKYRADALGGRFAIGAAPGGGTLLEFEGPRA